MTALIKCTDDWLKTLEDGDEVCTVFFDYRKAFDSVPHCPLMIKLRSLGLDDCIIRWLKSYLSNRMQVVVVMVWSLTRSRFCQESHRVLF